MSEKKKIPSIDELIENVFGFNPFNKNEKIIDKNIICSVPDCGAIAEFKCPECGKLVCDIFHTRGKYCYNCTKEGLEIDEEPYEQYIKWDNEALIELSDVLIDDRKIVVINDNSNFYIDYIKPIETNNILADIIKAVQEYYNKVKKEHRSSCVYIEGIVVEHTKDKIFIHIQHGT